MRDPHIELLWSLWGSDDLAQALAGRTGLPLDTIRSYVAGHSSEAELAVRPALESLLPIASRFYAGLSTDEVDEFKFLRLIKEQDIQCVRLRGVSGKGARSALTALFEQKPQ